MFLFLVIIIYRFYEQNRKLDYIASYAGYTMCMIFSDGTNCLNLTTPNKHSWLFFSVDSSMMGLFIFQFFGLKRDNINWWCNKIRPKKSYHSDGYNRLSDDNK